MSIYIGLDVGTTSLSALALDTRAGRVIAQVSSANDAASTRMGRSGQLYAELDLARLEHLLMDVLEQLAWRLPDAGRVRAIGMTGQQHGLALFSRELEPLGPAITWQDQRILEPTGAGDETYLDALLRQAGGQGAFANMGCLPAPGYMGVSLYWLSQRSELPVQATYACLIPDAALTLLTRTPPCTDPTDAGSSGLFDIVRSDWDWQLIERLGLPGELFVPVRPAGSAHAPLSPEAAERTGLGRVPVCVAAGDNQASFLGSVRDPASCLLINMGTGGQVSARVDAFQRLPEIETRAFFGGGYLLVGAGLYGGRAYAYLRDFYREVGVALWGADPSTELYEKMNALAAQVPPGCDGLRCEPLFTGTRSNPNLRASFSGIGPTNMRPGHFARALLEGLAEGMHALYREMRPAVGERDTLVGAGNAITRNPLLAEILAQRFGQDLHVAAHVEAAALGAALLACAGVGDKSLAEVSQRVSYDRVVSAQPG